MLIVKQKLKPYLLTSDVIKALIEGNHLQVLFEKKELLRASLSACVSNLAEVFIWAINLDLPNSDATVEVARGACSNWSRVAWEQKHKAYQAQECEQHSNPNWTFATFDSLLQSAFAGRIIDSMDHPVLQELLGLKSTQ
jgi:hypothetical protein